MHRPKLTQLQSWSLSCLEMISGADAISCIDDLVSYTWCYLTQISVIHIHASPLLRLDLPCIELIHILASSVTRSGRSTDTWEMDRRLVCILPWDVWCHGKTRVTVRTPNLLYGRKSLWRPTRSNATVGFRVKGVIFDNPLGQPLVSKLLCNWSPRHLGWKP